MVDVTAGEASRGGLLQHSYQIIRRPWSVYDGLDDLEECFWDGDHPDQQSLTPSAGQRQGGSRAGNTDHGDG